MVAAPMGVDCSFAHVEAEKLGIVDISYEVRPCLFFELESHSKNVRLRGPF